MSILDPPIPGPSLTPWTQAITLIIVSIFIYVILKRSSRVLAGADPSVEFPLLRPLLLQILATFALFFVRLVMRIAEGAQGGSRTRRWERIQIRVRIQIG